MSYVITRDYSRIIQTAELNAITAKDLGVRLLQEQSVQADITSRLTQRYDLANEFQNLGVYSVTVPYIATNRFYLDAPAYDGTLQYLAASKARVLFSAQVYIIAVDTPNPAGTFDPTKWTLLGSQYDIFYAQYPQPLFDQRKFYNIGDMVFWKGKVYTAAKPSGLFDQQNKIDALDIDQDYFLERNFFPDNPKFGLQYWGAGTTYTIPTGTLPTNTTYFTFGDNRDQKFVEIFLDMVVYCLCKRIAPQNVPKMRHDAYAVDIDLLNAYAMGDLTPSLPPLPKPESGGRIRWGGKAKQENSW